MRPDQLPEEARLPHARRADHRDDLTASSPRRLERGSKRLHLGAPPDELREPALRRRLQSGARDADSGQIVNLEGRPQALDGNRAERSDLEVAFDQPERARGDPGASRRGELLHPRGQVDRLPHRRVIHVQIVVNRPHHDLSGVESDSRLHFEAVGAAQILAVPANGVLHVERRVARAHRMVLVRHGRAE